MTAWFRAFVWGLAAQISLPGCFAANSYTSARTVPEGQQEFLVASEYVDLQNSLPAAENQPRPLQTRTRGHSLFPSVVGMRWGIGPDLDMAITVRGLGTIHGELKKRVLSGAVDVAVVPGVDVGVWYEGAKLPVLVSAQLGKYVEPFASVGIEGVVKIQEPYAAPSGILLRGGGGVRLNLPRFAVQDISLIPEVTYVRNPFSPRDRGLVAGVGLVVGL
jgi:hypothetical protein